MAWLADWFQYPADPLLLAGSYDAGLVTLSILVAVVASAMAFHITAQAIHVQKKSRRWLMLATGSVALGGGVWSMHFIGMLSFSLCTEVTYTSGLTFFSMLPSIAASWVALDLISKKHLHLSQLCSGGVLVGAGIGTMHYSGMAAMQMAVALKYDLATFILSIVVAIVLAMLAIWIRFGLKRLQLAPLWLTLLSGIVMGCAISGMHYIGMAAARFVPPAGFRPELHASEMPMVLAMAISFATLVICSLVVAVNLLLKYRDASTQARANETRLKAMMDTAVDGIVTINAEGRIVSINSAAEQIFGWEPDALLGKNVNVLTPNTIRLDHDDYLSNYLTSGDAKIIGVGRDVMAVTKDGKPLPVRLAIGHVKLPTEDLFVAFITDLSARREMEQALSENEAKFRSLIGNIPGAAYRCLNTPSWDMVFISSAIEGITGYPASDFMLPHPQRRWTDLVEPADLPYVQQMDQTMAGFQLEYRIRHQNGSLRWVLEQGEAIRDEAGEIQWLDGFIMDITQRKQMETELRDAKEKAELAAEARSAFLANMSHEIRTPMNAIIGFSDLLLSAELTTEHRKHLSTIHQSARSLLHLLNDILDSAKLEKGKMELEFANFSLPALLDTVVSTLWIQARKKQLQLLLQFDQELGEYYFGSPDRLRQILTNLIGNAIKFTESGSVTVIVSACTPSDLPPQADPNQHWLTFQIIDTGIGIASDRIAHIFDAFTQADASMTRRFGGTGLGTTISKQLVELMGGSISVTSQLGAGSCFTFSLPFATGQRVAHPSPDSRISLPPLRILIADDIQQNIDLLKLILERAGHHVTAVNDGYAAVNAVQTTAFDLVLMDIQMPQLDGLQACRRIREFESANEQATLPIIALTASVLAEDKAAAEEAGMQGFASKPIDFPVLCAEIARVLQLSAVDTLPSLVPLVQSQSIHLNKALQLWGSLSLYLPALTQFLQQQQQHLAQQRSNWQGKTAQAGEFALLQQWAHSIKGSSGNLALDTLSKVSAELEQAARQHQQFRCDELLDTMTGLFIVLTDECAQLQQQQPTALNAALSLPPAALLTLLQALQPSVQAHQFDEPLLEQLSQYQGPWSSALQLLLTSIHDFDFQQAQQRLSDVMAQLQTRAADEE